VPVGALRRVALERQGHEPVDQLGVGHAGGLEQLASSSTPYVLIARMKGLADLSFLPLEAVVRDKEYVLLRSARERSIDHH